MSDAPSYAEPVAVGEVMVGGTVSRVEATKHTDYKPGDMVLGYIGWYPDRRGKSETVLHHLAGIATRPGGRSILKL